MKQKFLFMLMFIASFFFFTTLLSAEEAKCVPIDDLKKVLVENEMFPVFLGKVSEDILLFTVVNSEGSFAMISFSQKQKIGCIVATGEGYQYMDPAKMQNKPEEKKI